MLTRRLGSIWLSVAAATAIGPRPTAAGDVAAKHTARFAGEWVIGSIEQNGASNEARLPPESCLLTIQGQRIEFFTVNLASGIEEKGTFSVVEAGPGGVKVDVRVVVRSGTDLGRQPDRALVRKELWRMTDGGKFQRCYPRDPSGPRPSTFSTKKGDGVDLLTFARRPK
jgi:hypothetical protein